LLSQFAHNSSQIGFIGRTEDGVDIIPITRMEEMVDWEHKRSLDQWWMELAPIIDELSHEPVDDETAAS